MSDFVSGLWPRNEIAIKNANLCFGSFGICYGIGFRDVDGFGRVFVTLCPITLVFDISVTVVQDAEAAFVSVIKIPLVPCAIGVIFYSPAKNLISVSIVKLALYPVTVRVTDNALAVKLAVFFGNRISKSSS